MDSVVVQTNSSHDNSAAQKHSKSCAEELFFVLSNWRKLAATLNKLIDSTLNFWPMKVGFEQTHFDFNLTSIGYLKCEKKVLIY